MDEDDVNSAIVELERWFNEDEPSAGRRLRWIRLLYVTRVALVVVALIAAIVLLTAGLVMTSGTAWLVGVVAFLAAFAADPNQNLRNIGHLTGVDQPVDQWDESVSVPGAWSTLAGELRAAGGLDRWCPTVRPITDNSRPRTDTVAIGRWRPVRLEVRRRFFADGIRWRAEADGPVLVGRVTVQPMTATGEVVVSVHAEAPRCRRSRRVLRAVRHETKAGLRRWAATRGSETGQ